LIQNLPYKNAEVNQENNLIDKGYYNIINIGNNQPTNLMDFINLLEKTVGKKALIKFLPMQQGDVFTTFANIDRISALSSFRPRTTLDEGIKEFVDWYKSFYQIIN
jgi:UDP-glucuronate 4-epimerase